MSLLDALPHVVWQADASGALLALSARWAEYTGLSIDASIEEGWASAVHPEDALADPEARAELFASGGPRVHRARMRRRDGVWRWNEIRCAPVADVSTAVRWIGTCTDVDVDGSQPLEHEIARAHAVLTTLVQQAPLGIAILDGDLRFLVINDTLAKMHDVPREAHLGKRIDEVFEAEDLARIAGPMRAVLESGEPLIDHEIAWRWSSAPGGQGHVLRTIFPLRSDGRVVGLAALVFDVSERTRLTDARRKSEQAFATVAHVTRALAQSMARDELLGRFVRSVVENMADVCAVYLRDPRGHVRCVAAAEAGSRRPPARAMGELFADRPDVPHGISWVLRTGNADLVDVDAELIRSVARDDAARATLEAAGARSWIIVPLAVKTQVVGAVMLEQTRSKRRYELADRAIAEELARRVGAALENALLLEEAQRANQIKDEFLSVVSHELRTPLSTILGWSKLLSDDPNPSLDRVKKGLAVIQRNAVAQARLVDDILDTSRILRDHVTLDPTTIGIGAVMEEAMEVVRASAESRGVTLELEIDRSAVAKADGTRLRQVFYSLLSNAVKFTPRGGRIAARVAREESAVVASVTDTGAGIDPSYLPYVFEGFRQADASVTRTHGGLGIGLAVSRKLVELHGGSIAVESPGLGDGATFTIRLPERRRTEPGASTGGAPSRARARTPDLGGVRVLLVDDHDDARDLYGSVLSLRGAKVVLAASAADARARMLDGRFDILVSDIGMPIEDGCSLVRFARAHDATMRTVAISAFTRPEDVARARDAGFERYLTKPVDTHELSSAVAELVRERA